mmetsp:Transcript_18246/g.38101  ORF Transcript_18246/g.38101 Transcript_18246/m.38101 type:complete len:88 (-) Transcript_18246:366-629(-)
MPYESKCLRRSAKDNPRRLLAIPLVKARPELIKHNLYTMLTCGSSYRFFFRTILQFLSNLFDEEGITQGTYLALTTRLVHQSTLSTV